MDSQTAKIKNHYDSNPQREWMRLDQYKIEFAVTLANIKKYLNQGSKILDVGGGPGRYSFELAKSGHLVWLNDLSHGNIELANKKENELGIKLQDARQMDATDLSFYSDATFDCVLNMGPIYHSQNKSIRQKIISESIRILKPGGIAVFAFLSIYAPVYDILKKDLKLIHDRMENLLKYISTGLHTESTKEPGFTDIFLIDPMKINEEFSGQEIQQISLFGAEGLTAQSEDKIQSIDSETKRKWIQLAIDTCETPAAVNSAEHIVFIGRKLESKSI
jgi:S-adenosylmethionine-dependent methyltransferase